VQGGEGATQERKAILARSSWRAASLSSTTVSASLIGTIDVNDKVLDRFVGHAKAWAPFGHYQVTLREKIIKLENLKGIFFNK
jgi:hypothetical protein